MQLLDNQINETYHMRIKDIIKEKLLILNPSYLSIDDVSHHHAGHAGARPNGESHFNLIIVTDAFNQQGKLARQRMIYQLLDQELKQEIHALSIKAYSTAEYSLMHPSADWDAKVEN